MVWVSKLPVNQQILTVQVDSVELRTISHNPLSQECLPWTQVDLAPVVVQQVAVVKIPMNQDKRSPIWLCTSLMMWGCLCSSLLSKTESWRVRPWLPPTSRDHWILRNLLSWARWCKAWLYWCIPLGLPSGSSRACGLKTPLWCGSLFFLHWTGINQNSLSTTRGPRH